MLQGGGELGKYTCLICQKEFSSESGVKYHISKTHSQVGHSHNFTNLYIIKHYFFVNTVKTCWVAEVGSSRNNKVLYLCWANKCLTVTSSTTFIRSLSLDDTDLFPSNTVQHNHFVWLINTFCSHKRCFSHIIIVWSHKVKILNEYYLKGLLGLHITVWSQVVCPTNY